MGVGLEGFLEPEDDRQRVVVDDTCSTASSPPVASRSDDGERLADGSAPRRWPAACA